MAADCCWLGDHYHPKLCAATAPHNNDGNELFDVVDWGGGREAFALDSVWLLSLVLGIIKRFVGSASVLMSARDDESTQSVSATHISQQQQQQQQSSVTKFCPCEWAALEFELWIDVIRRSRKGMGIREREKERKRKSRSRRKKRKEKKRKETMERRRGWNCWRIPHHQHGSFARSSISAAAATTYIFLSFFRFLFLFLSVSPKRRRPTAVGWVGHGAIDRFGEKERKREREKESSMCPAITGAADCCCDGSIEGAFVMAQQQE